MATTTRLRILFQIAAALAALAAPALEAAVAHSVADTVALKEDGSYQRLVEAANAVVGVNVKALPNARSNASLGQERKGSGVVVYTHVPSSLLLFTIVAADRFELAAFLFLVREALSEMDVPTRQSYVMAVVKPEERLAAAGITALVRSGGWALAPVFAGMMMHAGGLGLPLAFAGITKLGYDLLLWREFRRVKPPEELSG